MTVVPTIGHGCTIAFGTSTFTAMIRSLSGPTMTLDAVDASHTGTTYRTRVKIPGMLDIGELTMELVYDADQYASGENPFSDQYVSEGWTTAAGAAETETITITWPMPYDKTSAATWAATGFISSWQPEAPLEDLCTASCTVTLTGDITYAASS